MPHLRIEYTGNLEPEARIGELCATLGDVLRAQRGEDGARLYPIGGTRVLAYPAAAWSVADGAEDRAFVYLNLRMAPGRPAAAIASTGDALIAAVQRHFATLFSARPLGITLQIDEGAPAYDVKHSNLHPLFAGT